VNNALLSQLKLFPNPVISNGNTSVSVLLPQCGRKASKLTIIDMSGKKLYEKYIVTGTGTIQLPIAQLDLGAGMYRIVINYENEIVSSALLIQ
jgi:hypothetical protein